MADVLLLNGRYQLLHPLATGGMSVVHKAHDMMLDRTVAIKLLREDFFKDPGFRDRFKQEARAAANLSHPNIVTVFDFGLDQKYLFIVMEFLPGTDLKTLIRQKGKFSANEGLSLLIQACAGIGYAHRSGLVHCDVKPHNMMVTPDQRLKVTDFGIARIMASIPPGEQSEVVWGSPHYFSPEQAAGLAPSPSSDVYSLGIILYEMLTGQMPFNGGDATELARMHREDQPLPPRRLNPAIPQPLEEIILKVLSKEPAQRYRTADQLGRLLTNLAQSQGMSTPDALYNSKTGPTAIKQPITKPVQSPVTKPAVNNSKLHDATPTVPPPIKPAKEKTGRIRAIPAKFDWLTWALGLIAFTLLLGLIPFWLYIYLTLIP